VPQNIDWLIVRHQRSAICCYLARNGFPGDCAGDGVTACAYPRLTGVGRQPARRAGL